MKTVEKSPALKKAFKRYIIITVLSMVGGIIMTYIGYPDRNSLILVAGVCCISIAFTCLVHLYPREFIIKPGTLIFDSKTGYLVFDSKNIEKRFLFKERANFLQECHCEGEPAFVLEEEGIIEANYPVCIKHEGKIKNLIIRLKVSGYMEKEKLVNLVQGKSRLVQDALSQHARYGETSLVTAWFTHTLADFCRSYSAKDFEKVIREDSGLFRDFVKNLCRHVRDAGYDYNNPSISVGGLDAEVSK